MMFTCCHPALPEESQIALTLRLLCGLSPAEIGAALLAGEAAVEKRLFRARERLRAAAAPFEVPRGDELLARLDVVMAVLYLLFNAGYSSSGEHAIRKELCLEALRLALLLERRFGRDEPRASALVALMCFHSARLPARLDADGSLNLLRDQDRRLWDRELIGRGLERLAAASSGPRLSAYHIEAGIAACHCAASSFESTDWSQILWLYEALLEQRPSPVVRLNRAIALGHVQGPRAALEALRALEDEPGLRGYCLLPATLGEFHRRAGDREAALASFRRALELAGSEAERRLLRARCEG
jgi:RNA polymerase sigma-70 factor (ECF subfamily)